MTRELTMEKARFPVNGRVVVEEIKTEEKKTAAGIILVEKETRGKIKKGIIYLVDEDVKKLTQVQEGCTVYYRPGSGYDIPLDGKDYLIMRATDLELVERN